MTELQWLTCDDFIDVVGQGFDVDIAEGAPLTLHLVSATESDEPGGTGPQGQVRKQFSLVFSGSPDRLLPQGTYRLNHPRLGQIDLFLVPLGPDTEGMQYEAAFA